MLEDTAVNGSMLYVCSLIDDGTSESKLAPCTAGRSWQQRTAYRDTILLVMGTYCVNILAYKSMLDEWHGKHIFPGINEALIRILFRRIDIKLLIMLLAVSHCQTLGYAVPQT